MPKKIGGKGGEIKERMGRLKDLKTTVINLCEAPLGLRGPSWVPTGPGGGKNSRKKCRKSSNILSGGGSWTPGLSFGLPSSGAGKDLLIEHRE